MATVQATNGMKKATFLKTFTDPETNITVEAGAVLEIIEWGQNRILCQATECPISVPRDVIEIK